MEETRQAALKEMNKRIDEVVSMVSRQEEHRKETNKKIDRLTDLVKQLFPPILVASSHILLSPPVTQRAVIKTVTNVVADEEQLIVPLQQNVEHLACEKLQKVSTQSLSNTNFLLAEGHQGDSEDMIKSSNAIELSFPQRFLSIWDKDNTEENVSTCLTRAVRIWEPGGSLTELYQWDSPKDSTVRDEVEMLSNVETDATEETTPVIDSIREHESLSLADSALEAECFHPQELLSQFQVLISSLEPSRKRNNELLDVVDDCPFETVGRHSLQSRSGLDCVIGNAHQPYGQRALRVRSKEKHPTAWMLSFKSWKFRYKQMDLLPEWTPEYLKSVCDIVMLDLGYDVPMFQNFQKAEVHRDEIIQRYELVFSHCESENLELHKLLAKRSLVFITRREDVAKGPKAVKRTTKQMEKHLATYLTWAIFHLHRPPELCLLRNETQVLVNVRNELQGTEMCLWSLNKKRVAVYNAEKQRLVGSYDGEEGWPPIRTFLKQETETIVTAEPEKDLTGLGKYPYDPGGYFHLFLCVSSCGFGHDKDLSSDTYETRFHSYYFQGVEVVCYEDHVLDLLTCSATTWKELIKWGQVYAFDVFHSPRPPEFSCDTEDARSVLVECWMNKIETMEQNFSSLGTKMISRREYCNRVKKK